MAITNGISGQNYTFTSGTGDWTTTNATAVRSLNSSVYRNFRLAGSDTPIVAEHSLKVTADGVGIASATLSDIVVVAGTQSIASAMITTDLDVATRNAYVQASVEYFDGAGGSLGTETATAVEVTLENAGERFWANVRFSSTAPDLAETAALTFSFASGGSSYGTTPTSGDVWLIAAPSLISVDGFDIFTANAYSELPDFVRKADADTNGHLLRFMQSLFTSTSAIQQLASALRFDRAIDGEEHLPSLVDPDNMPVAYFAWLASVLGVQLGASASAAGSNWSTLYTLADTDAGRAHDPADGTAGDGITTWSEWYTEFSSTGAESTFLWSNIAAASGGSFDGEAASRLLLKHAASGVHAGKISTMDSFLREFVNPTYQFLLKSLEYTSPQYTKLVADDRDVTDGGLVLQNFLDLISPAGTSTVVSASSTPMKEAATFAFLSDYYGEAVGTFGPQGLANEAGGAVTAALMASQIDVLPVLGGIIGPAPFGPGCALLSGYRVAAEEVDADYDLGVSGSTENFDLIIGVSSVTLPPSGGGTSSATIPADSRYLARGENWSLHLNNAGNVILVWDINGTPQILTSSATYDFGNKSDVAVQYIRINKVGTALKLYVQDSLFSDWDDNQLGTDLTITTSAITGATSDYLRILESDDPSGNDYIGSLSCAVHRVLLFTASSGSAWAEEAGEYYDYEGHANKVFDLDFGELDSSNYYDASVAVTGGTFDINDNGGANLDAGAAANDLTIANDGTYDYVNIASQEIAVYDDEPLFVHDEFTFTTVIKDPASTPDLKLINYAHEDVGTVFTLELIQDTTTKVSVSLTDGASSPTTLEPTDLDTSGWGAGEWHTITATYSPANGLKLYDDGVLSATDASAELVFADISQAAGSLGRRSNVQIGEGSTATGNVDCRYVAFHQFEMTAAQALALAGELGTV